MARASSDPGRLRDLCVLGGGVAGLACAVRAAAFGLDVAICADPGALRSWWAGKVHAHFGFPEGLSGRALLERGFAQAEAAGVERIEGGALSARPREDGTFDVRARIGVDAEPPLALGARFLVLADEPPDVPDALAALLAPAGIAPPDAFTADEPDMAGRRVLAFASGPAGVRAALEAARLASSLTILVPLEEEPPGEALRQRLEATGARLVAGTPIALEGREAAPNDARAPRLAAVQLDGGGRIECDCAIVVPDRRATLVIGATLGLDAAPGWIAADAAGRTSLSGCWVVDAAPPWRGLTEAAHAGARVALDVWTVLQQDRKRPRPALDLDTD